ncbi:MAG: polyprenyl synthetase family protein, partial [Balneolaceae bacterium]
HTIPYIEKALRELPIKEKPATLYDPCRYVLGNGGKRIRPALVLIAARLYGASHDRALPAALSIELIHNFTLVHDDIMDQAETRRGRKTVHKKWTMPVAILAGDELMVEALRILSGYLDSMSTKQFQLLYNTILDSTRTVCEGQALDLEFEHRFTVSSSEYLEMIEGKTAALISASLVSGAIVAGASDQELKALDRLGKDLGLAFQIQDDLLDVIADEAKFGKVSGGDIREGKKTYLMLLALERCSGSELVLLQNCTSGKEVTDRMVDDAVQIFRDSGVIDDAKLRMTEYYRSALATVNRFEDSPAKEDLMEIINFLNRRDH